MCALGELQGGLGVSGHDILTNRIDALPAKEHQGLTNGSGCSEGQQGCF
ncbi:hypothetical protein ES705_22935 [subsurface metagenome]